MRILVVDDYELFRRGICSLLATQATLTVCGEAVDGWDAVDKARALRPDVVIMDINMPKMDGLEATRQITQLVPEAKIVIVSQHESLETVRDAFNAGARGYVAKSTVRTDLLEAVRKVATASCTEVPQ
jgi:DNA-binding NarL/FixJ family response regulator